MRSLPRARVILGAVLALALAGVAPSPALAQSSWWRLGASIATAPARSPEAQLLVTASDAGDAALSATVKDPVTVTDELPPGATPSAVEGQASYGATVVEGSPGTLSCSYTESATHPTASCSFAGTLPPSASIWMRITLALPAPAHGAFANTVKLARGSLLEATLPSSLSVSEGATPFGVQSYELAPEEEGGAPDAQSGSHSFQLATALAFNQTLASFDTVAEKGIFPSAPALPRNLHFTLPPGLVGRVQGLPRCTEAQFSALAANKTNLCAGDTAVGTAGILYNNPVPQGLKYYSVPVFNLEPAPGEPARLGFEFESVPVVLKTAVPAGGDYAVRVSVEDASQAVQVLASMVTLWGVPGDPSHDSARGWECIDGGIWNHGYEGRPACPETPEQQPLTPFLTLPTACAPMESSVEGESWPFGEHHEVQSLQGETRYRSPALTGCPLAFDPSLAIEPEARSASTPTGLNATVTMAQAGLLEPEGSAESAVQNTTVTLPEGLTANPSSANGLAACSLKAIGYEGANPETGMLEFQSGGEEELLLKEGRRLSAAQQEALEAHDGACPRASKLGTVEIETPLLSEKLTGNVYLAEPAPDGEAGKNPFNSLLALYIVAENPNLGVLVKLAGEGKLNETTGQIATTFKNTPQVPFSRLKLHLFGREHEGPGEEREALSTPPFCGTTGHRASGSFTGWSEGVLSAPLSEPFPIESGALGGACPPDPLSFAPSFSAGAPNTQAGAFTAFQLHLERPDGQQALTGLSVQLPPGDSAMLSSVTPCPLALADAAQCPEGSRVGESSASAGLGFEPFVLPGSAYLTAGFDGAPFGISVTTPAEHVGPFDIGTFITNSTISVDPNTAVATIATRETRLLEPDGHSTAFASALPSIVKGIPAQIKRLTVNVNRPGFTFNPTNCNPLSIAATLSGAEGGSDSISYPFQAQNCATLPFAPVLTAGAAGHASKANGTSFTVRVTSAGLGQANIAKVDVQLPKQLSSRLTTIQKACVAATFESTPTPGGACDEGSEIGSATVHTPVLKNPVSGPAYLVSHGGAAFPDIEFVLQGEGITLVLDGHTDIKNGITYTKFESVPDQPFTSFETVLPAGPHSALTANVAESKDFDLCGEQLVMPTTIVAQNGAVIEQSTQIAIEGCGQVKGVKTKKLTRAQRLAAALKACRHKYKHAKTKRVACEKAARKRFGPQKKAKKAKKAAVKTQKK